MTARAGERRQFGQGSSPDRLIEDIGSQPIRDEDNDRCFRQGISTVIRWRARPSGT